MSEPAPPDGGRARFFFFAPEARAHSLTCWSALAAYSSLARARFFFCRGGRARFFFCCGRPGAFFFFLLRRRGLTHSLVGLPWRRTPPSPGRVVFLLWRPGAFFVFLLRGRARFFFLLWRPGAFFLLRRPALGRLNKKAATTKKPKKHGFPFFVAFQSNAVKNRAKGERQLANNVLAHATKRQENNYRLLPVSACAQASAAASAHSTESAADAKKVFDSNFCKYESMLASCALPLSQPLQCITAKVNGKCASENAVLSHESRSEAGGQSGGWPHMPRNDLREKAHKGTSNRLQSGMQSNGQDDRALSCSTQWEGFSRGEPGQRFWKNRSIPPTQSKALTATRWLGRMLPHRRQVSSTLDSCPVS